MKVRTFAWLALALIVAAGVGFAAWAYEARRGFETRVRALRDAGEPVDLSELPRPDVPDDQNAAPMLRSVLKRLDDLGFEKNENGEYEGWFPYLVEERSPEANRRAIEIRASLYAELDAALERPKFRLADDASGGPFRGTIRRIMAVSQAAGYIDARARVDLESRGGVPRAKKAIRQLMRLASYLRSEGAMPHVARMAVEAMALARLRSILASAPLDPERLRTELDPLFAAADVPGRIQIVLRNERAWGITNYRQLLFDLPDRSDLQIQWHKRPSQYRAASNYIDTMARVIEAVHGSAPETLARLRLVGVETDYAGGGIVLRVFMKDRLHLAALRTVRIALALEVHHARHGRYPAALSKLAPLFPDGVPLEPYTGAPFRYEATDSTAVLRSGLDEAPDGGYLDDEWNAIPWELAKQ